MIKKYGLIGRKLGHSLSPEIHEYIFEALSIKGSYDLLPMELDNVPSFVSNLVKDKYIGINVTIPYKMDVMPYVDKISKEAAEIGAINTIHVKDNILYGYNTDYFGFEMTLKNFDIDVKNKKVIVLGAGGSAKAIIAWLRDNNVEEVLMLNRNVEKAKKAFPETKIDSYDSITPSFPANIIINCTPSGMYPKPDECPIDIDNFSGLEVVIDLIYNPEETLLLKKARDKGIKAVNGLYMLVAQAIKSQEIWNNRKIPDSITGYIFNELSGRKNIVLIGMPGSGKSTVGKILAKELDMGFIDMDNWIEENYGEIKEIFKRGEQAFREIETLAAKDIGEKRGYVIATGGGVITREENIKYLRQNGIIYFIDRSVEEILKDIKHDTRPLIANNIDNINKLYKDRYSLYNKYSNVKISGDTRLHEIVNNIIINFKGD